MKKICIITPNVLPVPSVKGGAVETLVTNLINQNEKNGDFEFTVVSIYNEQAKQQSLKYKNTNFKYIKIPFNDIIEKLKAKFTKKTIFDRFIRKILRIINYIYSQKVFYCLKDCDFDYILIEGGNPFEYCKILEKYGRDKCICHLHGNITGNDLYKTYFSKFIAISEYVKNKFIENGIIKSDDVYIINNGIELSAFQKKITQEEIFDIKSKYNISKDDIVIEFCGRTIPEKGIKELIIAFKEIKNIERAKLLIIGNSQFGNNVLTQFDKELIAEMKGFEDKIIFTGYIHNSELYKILGISDISVIPSIWEEPSGLVVMEAMSSGLPIITTDSGGIPELVNEDCAVVLKKDKELTLNLTKELDKLISEDELRKKMGLQGRTLAQNYSVEKYYYNFVTLFNLMS